MTKNDMGEGGSKRQFESDVLFKRPLGVLKYVLHFLGKQGINPFVPNALFLYSL